MSISAICCHIHGYGRYVLDVGLLYCVDGGMEVFHSDDILKVRWIKALAMP